MAPRPLRLVLDFDGTITKSDTMANLASACYAAHCSKNFSSNSNAGSAPPPWSHFSDAWLADYSGHAARYAPCASERRSLQQEAAWLRSLAEVECRSFDRVAASGLFDGVKTDDLRGAARQCLAQGRVSVRSGFGELVSALAVDADPGTPAASALRGRVDVLSVNWSGAWIWACLRAAAELQIGVQEQALRVVTVWANELPGLSLDQSERVGCVGEGRAIRTSGDKLEVMKSLLASGLQEEQLVVYVGDSTTDLECLVAADVGICVREAGGMRSGQRELAETLQRVGIECRSLDEFSMETKGVMWWITDFTQVSHWRRQIQIGSGSRE